MAFSKGWPFSGWVLCLVKCMIKVLCQNCGKEFLVHPYRVKQKTVKYCSKRCFYDTTIGKIPWNKGTKGLMPDVWNKGLNYHKDITGQKFNRLTAVKFIRKEKTYYYWLFKCDCGNEKIIRKDIVKCGASKSCGCLNDETRRKRFINNTLSLEHGMSGTQFYKIWDGMKDRCIYKNSYKKKYHGGRGITICNKWLKFENFRDDMYKSYLEHLEKFGSKDTTIDRINNNGNYCLENCRWATHKEQSNNTRANRIITYDNQTKTMSEWAKQLKMPYYLFNSRINQHKWTIERAITTPVKKYNIIK
jgi:hypothetical protein